MNTDDHVDQRLRAAGAAMRAAAPTASATEQALARTRVRQSRQPARWVLAAGLAAAAATVGVLVLNGESEDSIRQVPANSTVVPSPSAPPTTAPLVTAAPTAHASALPASPAFEPAVPLDARAAVNGCPGTYGDVAAAVDPALYPIVALECTGRRASVFAGAYVVRLRMGADRTWSEISRCGGANVRCGYGPSLPIPPAAVGARDLGDLDPVDVTSELQQVDGLPQRFDADRFADAISDYLVGHQAPDSTPEVTTEVVDGAPVVLVTLTGLADDASDELTYVIWYDRRPRWTARAYAVVRCSRGVTADDSTGQPLCV